MAKEKFSRTKACATKTLYAVMKEMSRRGGSMPAKELYPFVNENVNHGVGESDHFFNLTNPKYMISGLYTKKISIKVDFLANIFGRINFYVYFCGRIRK